MSRKSFAVLAAMALLFSVLALPAAGAVEMRAATDRFEQASGELTIANPFKNETAGMWIVQLEDDSAATYQGGVTGLAATSPTATGADKLDVTNREVMRYSTYLERRQTDVLARMRSSLGRSIEPRFTYTQALNGFSVWLTPDEAAQVARMPGVKSIQKSAIRTLDTDYGPQWIGAPSIWEGTATGVATKGEGVLVGIIDSGINPENPSFADVGADGYDHTNPFGAGNYVGACDPSDTENYEPDFVCNDKLIGAWSFFVGDDGSAIDHDGHGSHTASTTAGNVTDATLVAPTLTLDTRISGVAPHANIISYRVCGDEDLGQAGCQTDAIVAAINQAIVDGVDVINYSIGSATATDPWTQADDLAFLAARDAGIHVAHSAGNEGPDAATSGSPNAPWMTHVAAMTHDRQYINFVQDMSGGDTTPPADIQGLGFTAGFGPAEIVYAGDYPSTLTDTPELCGVGTIGDEISPWPAGTFDGQIVVCDRGTFGRVEKGHNVLTAGAGGFVLVDNGAGLVGDPHELPGVHITQADGAVLKTWLASGADHMATISGSILDVADANGDILAGFSSRGPNPEAEWLMPNVAAPGVDIIAAHGKYGETVWTFLSGTSMASPHVAGSFALMDSLYPDWSPAEVQSALMTTAKIDVRDENLDPASPFDVGSGRVQLELAAKAGLVLDETTADYEAADPAIGGDPMALNLASVYNDQCVLECSWVRTVTSSLDAPMTWTTSSEADGGVILSVSPAEFTLDAGESQDITITADVSGAAANEFHFGYVYLTPGSSDVPVAHLTAAVQPTTGSIPDIVEISTRRNAGSWLVSGLESFAITDFTATVDGLTKATLTDASLFEDSDNGSAYDDPTDGGFVTLVDVPVGANELIAEIVKSGSPDLDMFVGFDANNDGIPQEGEQECVSASGTAFESCRVADPGAGTWWVLVQNWAGSANQPDAVTLATAVLDGTDAGNLTVEGPDTVEQLVPYDVRLFWDADMVEGDIFYGSFSLGTDPGNAGNIGTVPVVLTRYADDVTKTVSAEEASGGEVLTYQLTIQPNVTNEDLAYTIDDVIPDGFTYVDGSASASEGTVTVTDGVVHYEGVALSPAQAESAYVMTTSATDALCDTGFGGYLDAESLGFSTDPTVSGDTQVWTFFASQPIDFYGDTYTGLPITDDGFAVFDAAGNYGGQPWVPQVLPDPALPNNVAAALWQDFEIFYDGPSNSGVTVVGIPGLVGIAEYDNVQLYGGSPDLLDFETVVWFEVDDSPGAYEIIYAYDNVDYSFPATIGVENASGTEATSLLDDESTAGVIDSGFQVCFDWTGPSFDPITIEYQVTVDFDAAAGTYTNTAVHTVDNPGSTEGSASADVEITNPTPVELKTAAASVLEAAIASGAGSVFDQRMLAEGLDYLEKSVNPSYWVDEFHLDSTRGRAVFFFEASGAVRLMRIRPSSPVFAAATQAMDLMAMADEKLAIVAWQEAAPFAAEKNPWFSAAALRFLEDGQAYADAGRYDQAIRFYGVSWNLSTSIMAHPGRYR